MRNEFVLRQKGGELMWDKLLQLPVKQFKLVKMALHLIK